MADLFGVGGTIVGVSLAVAGITLEWRARRAVATVETTTGRVLDAELGRGDIQSGEQSWSTYPIVRYEYEVAGRRYENDNYRLGAGRAASYATSDDKQVVESHESGDEVTVYYHPGEPARSFLDPEVNTVGHVTMVLFGVLFGAFAFLTGL